MKTDRKPILRAIEQSMRSLGFVKRGSVLILDLTDGVFGWVGLNTGSLTWVSDGERMHGFEVNAVVGVLHESVNRLVSELQGVKHQRWSPPTLGGHLGYLAPDDRWDPATFAPGEPFESEVDALVRKVESHGLPFMRRLVTLEALVEEMELSPRFALPDVRAYNVPVGLLLSGRASEGRAQVQSNLRNVGAPGNPYAVFYEAFAKRFEEYAARQ